jgi:hypothetical protein
MIVEKSSVVRTRLEKYIRSVGPTGIGIERNGEVVAVLTTEYSHAIPPVRIVTEEARKNWSDLLAAVSMDRGNFYCVQPGVERKVYLLRAEGYQNIFVTRWVEHSLMERPQDLDRIQVLRRELIAQLVKVEESLTKLKHCVHNI